MNHLTLQGLTHIFAFTRVVDRKSFTAAARQLGMSKATVSKHVTMLEENMGVRLLNRTTRTLGLTVVGARFYAHCQHIIAELDAAETEVMRFRTEPYGRLRVTASPSVGRLHVAPVLKEFLERYRNIEIDFTLSDQGIGLVEDGFDVAVFMACQENSSLKCVRLRPCAQVVCAASGYLDRYGMPDTPDDLPEHNCMTCAELSNGEVWRLEGPNGPQSLKVNGRLRTNNGDALRMAVLSGFGLALIPLFLVHEDLEAGRLRRVLPQYVDLSHSVYVVCPGQGHVSPNVKVFVEFLELCLGDSPCRAGAPGSLGAACPPSGIDVPHRAARRGPICDSGPGGPICAHEMGQ